MLALITHTSVTGKPWFKLIKEALGFLNTIYTDIFFTFTSNTNIVYNNAVSIKNNYLLYN